jgi:hypothetical protein
MNCEHQDFDYTDVVKHGVDFFLKHTIPKFLKLLYITTTDEQRI